jgi:AraC-like DNA-binding protein/mannose-6-phosphate isomerase-like protein (cupin superfamily)
MQQASTHSELNSANQQSRSWTHGPLLPASEMNGRFRGPKRPDHHTFSFVEPHINREGVHVWPFNASCPIDVLFLTEDARQPMRMHRHEYFEVLHLCSGSAICHVGDRVFPFEEGDLAVIGSTPYHSIECRTSTPSRLAALFFDPEVIRCDGGSDSVEYLTPFLLRDSEFPHVVPAKSGVPNQVLELMLGIRSELPASSPRASLAARTYLKMLLMLLVNQYSSYLRTIEIFQQQQRAVERLRPVFQYLGENCGSRVQVGDAARMCGMSESHFMTFFKRVTGLSFMKYLSQHRIQRAQALLVRTDRSLADISVGVGFCDQSYFGGVFRKLVGLTPAAYRHRYQNMRLSEPSKFPTRINGKSTIRVSVQRIKRYHAP